jgi:hypothetical protein
MCHVGRCLGDMFPSYNHFLYTFCHKIVVRAFVNGIRAFLILIRQNGINRLGFLQMKELIFVQASL